MPFPTSLSSLAWSYRCTSTPLTTVLLSKNPTKTIRFEDPGDTKAVIDSWPSGSVHVLLSLFAPIKALKKVRFQPAFGCGKEPSKALDVCGKPSELGEPKLRARRDGSPLYMADMTLVDDSGVSFGVTVQQKDTYNRLKDAAIGSGGLVSHAPLSETKGHLSSKFNAWLTVYVFLGGDQAEALTQLPASVAESCTSAKMDFIQKM